MGSITVSYLTITRFDLQKVKIQGKMDISQPATSNPGAFESQEKRKKEGKPTKTDPRI